MRHRVEQRSRVRHVGDGRGYRGHGSRHERDEPGDEPEEAGAMPEGGQVGQDRPQPEGEAEGTDDHGEELARAAPVLLSAPGRSRAVRFPRRVRRRFGPVGTHVRPPPRRRAACRRSAGGARPAGHEPGLRRRSSTAARCSTRRRMPCRGVSVEGSKRAKTMFVSTGWASSTPASVSPSPRRRARSFGVVSVAEPRPRRPARR